MNISDCDAVILAGGLGTRIKHLLPEGQPKCLANINGKPLIQLLLKDLRRSGLTKFVVSVGHNREPLQEWLSEISWAMHLKVVVDENLAGTGPAILQLMKQRLKLSDPFFVVNADTRLEGMPTLLSEALDSHINSCAPISAILDYNSEHTGIYVVSRSFERFLKWEKSDRFNLEDLPIHGFVNLFECGYGFIDIGTPEGLLVARKAFQVAQK